MRVLRIGDRWARKHVLAVDLVDVLRLLLGTGIEECGWFVEHAWVVRPMGDILDLYEGVDDVRRVPGATLLAWAARLAQVISCRVYGYRSGSAVPWIAIRAFDSAYYEVACDDEDVIGRINDRFHDVKELHGPTPTWATGPESEWPRGLKFM